MFEEVQQIQLATKKGSCVAWCMASKQIRTEFCLELKRIFDDDNYVPGILRDLKVKYLSIPSYHGAGLETAASRLQAGSISNFEILK